MCKWRLIYSLDMQASLVYIILVFLSVLRNVACSSNENKLSNFLSSPPKPTTPVLVISHEEVSHPELSHKHEESHRKNSHLESSLVNNSHQESSRQENFLRKNSYSVIFHVEMCNQETLIWKLAHANICFRWTNF